MQLNFQPHWKSFSRTCNEGNKLPALFRLNAHMPFLLVFWRLEGPLDEVTRIIESEHAVVILDIMACATFRVVPLLSVSIAVELESVYISIIYSSKFKLLLVV